MSKIKFIYFDIGGVLINGNSETAVKSIAEHFNLPIKEILSLLEKHKIISVTAH